MRNAALNYQYSIEDYLEMEENSLNKYEYHDGEIFAMAGGTLNHSLLSVNMSSALSNSLKSNSTKCLTFGSDAKISITNSKFVY